MGEAEEKDLTDNLNLEGVEKNFILYNNLGNVYFKKKDFEKALKCFEESSSSFNLLNKILDKTIQANQDFLKLAQKKVIENKQLIPECAQKLGDEKLKRREFFEALEAYKKIIYYQKNEDLYKKIAICLINLDANISAISMLNESLNLNPQNRDCYILLGNIYGEKLNDPQKAISLYEKALELTPDDNIMKSDFHNKLGHYYESLSAYGTVETQIKYFEEAIKLNPKNQSAHRNLTIVGPRAKMYDRTLEAFKKVFELGPKFDDLFDYACFSIKMKNFEEGWKYYEYRFQKETGPTQYPEIKKPRWKGQNNISGKTLLVQYEQGYGDSIMFCRYLEQVKKFTKKIIFKVQDNLYDLMKENLKGIDIVKHSTPLEKIHFNYHVPLLSLMQILKTNVDNIPMKQGYIKANEEKSKELKNKFFNNDKLKIGISWHGAAMGNKRRDIPLEAFYALAKVPNIEIYSLQKHAGTEELKDLPENIKIIDLDKEINTFSDTAAAMANLDIFITSDNGVFNLAGAMGVKTYLLLNNDAEWRWFLEDKVNPWYDSVEIFKKKSDLDSWESLIERVISEKLS